VPPLHVFDFDGQDGVPGKLFIERFEDGLRAEHQISGVLDLHETPVVRLGEDVDHRTALLGVPIEDVMQVGRRQVIGEGLPSLKVAPRCNLANLPFLIFQKTCRSNERHRRQHRR
jgi:hypothetical protein